MQFNGTSNYELQGTAAIYLGESIAGTLLPPATAAPTVITVSMAQARIALSQTPDPTGTTANMLAVINNYVTANSTANPVLGIAWEYAAEISSNNDLVNSVFTALGLPSSSVTTLFTLAQSITL